MKLLLKVNNYKEKKSLCKYLNYNGYSKENIAPPIVPNNKSKGEIPGDVIFWIDKENGRYDFNSKKEFIPKGEVYNFSEIKLNVIPKFKKMNA